MIVTLTPTGMLVWSTVCLVAGALITLRIQKVNKREPTVATSTLPKGNT